MTEEEYYLTGRNNSVLAQYYGTPSDGCSVPILKGWFNKRYPNAKYVCIAHDYGCRGLIKGIRPGIHNDWWFFKTNWKLNSKIWAIISFLWILPYTTLRYNAGLKVSPAPVYAFIVFVILNIYVWYNTR